MMWGGSTVRLGQALVLLACVGATAGCADAPPEGPCEAEVAHVVSGDTQVSEIELSPRATDEQCDQACRSLAAQITEHNFYLQYHLFDSTEVYAVRWCERTATLGTHPSGL
jgi:hypothetical protein